MILQNVIFPDKICQEKELYFRINGYTKKEGKAIVLASGSRISTDTYMNIFDSSYWRKYTRVNEVALYLRACGRFRLRCKTMKDGLDIMAPVWEKEYLSNGEEISVKLWNFFPPSSDYSSDTVSFSNEMIYLDETESLCFFEMEAIEETMFYSACYVSEDIVPNEVRIAVIICTYHRNKQLLHNLHMFLNSRFWLEADECYEKLKIYVVDNGRDIRPDFKDERVRIFPNSNAGGGSGGFTRGLKEVCADQDVFPCTHTVFMDDDVEFRMESFYRLYALLSLLKPEYRMRPVAGRMFRMNNRHVQYTAAEIWNKGKIIHVGGERDMRHRNNLSERNLSSGDYGGWWLCAYPALYSLNNKPFPFFIHCDDVEYGLRCGERPLILRGFQVWHETFEFRITPKIIYYDIRNALVVNMIKAVSGETDYGLIITDWKQRLDGYHNAGAWKEKYLCALALWHFGKVGIFNNRKGKLPEIHMHIAEKKQLAKMGAIILHRLAEHRVREKYEMIVKRYKGLL